MDKPGEQTVQTQHDHSSQAGVQEQYNQKLETKEELKEAIGQSSDALIRITTVFPLTLFPDTITLDRTKLTVTHREFFRVGEVLSIAIEDILNITAAVGPFFGSIKIATRFYDPGKTHDVNLFTRSDALRLKRIVQGYIIAKQKEIDCSALSNQELTKLLDDLGKVENPDKV